MSKALVGTCCLISPIFISCSTVLAHSIVATSDKFSYSHVTKEMALIAGIELSTDHVLLSPLMTTIHSGDCVGQPEKQILIKRSCFWFTSD